MKNLWLPLFFLFGIIVLTPSCEKEAFTATENTTEENLPNTSGFPIVGTKQITFYNNSTETSTQAVEDDYSEGFGPQGDAIRIYNHVRLVRNVN